MTLMEARWASEFSHPTTHHKPLLSPLLDCRTTTAAARPFPFPTTSNPPPLQHSVTHPLKFLEPSWKKERESRTRKRCLGHSAIVVTASTSFRSRHPSASSVAGGVNGAERQPVSVIIPVYNEVKSIPILVERVGAAMRRRGGPYEIICVDDGSTDGSTPLLKAMAAEREDLRVVIFRRNFGQTAAMAAGFDYAAGDLLVTLDGDLQNDAEDIPRLLDHLIYGGEAEGDVDVEVKKGGGERRKHRGWASGQRREDGGYDLVCGWRRNRKDHPLTRNLPSLLANWLIGRVTGVRLHDYGCSLKAYRKSVVQNLSLYGEMHRFIPALAAVDGASISELEVTHHARSYGESKYGLGRVPRVLIDLLTVTLLARFRDRPMRLFGMLAGLCIFGAITAMGCGSWGLLSSARAWGFPMALSSSSPSFVLALELLLSALQFVCLGFIADVGMRTYFESQQQRLYRVREVATSAR